VSWKNRIYPWWPSIGATASVATGITTSPGVGQTPRPTEADTGQKSAAIRAALDDHGRGVRETARLLKVSAAKVSEVRRMYWMAALPCPQPHPSDTVGTDEIVAILARYQGMISLR
jgi:hypothetical protein